MSIFLQKIWVGRGYYRGDIRPVKAMVLLAVVMCPPTHLHYPSNQLWATTAQVPMPACPPSLPSRLVAPPTLVSCMPRWATR